jgi:hypothetical protein
VINEFCYLHNIQMSKNLLEVLKMRDSQNEFRKSYKRELRNTEASEPCLRDRIVYLPTAESESNLHNKSLLLKSKSLETHEMRQNGQPMRQSCMRQSEALGQPTVSHIIQPRVSTEVAKQRNSYAQEGKPMKGSTMLYSNDFRKSAFVEGQIL